MEKLELNASVNDNGEVIIHNRRLMYDWAQKNIGKKLKIVIARAGSKRSLPQNAYYWGVVVEEVRLGLLNLGHQLTKDETHYWLKFKFNPIWIPNEHGEGEPIAGTTTTLTKTGFAEYIDKIIQWAAEYLSIQIPLPNEKLELSL